MEYLKRTLPKHLSEKANELVEARKKINGLKHLMNEAKSGCKEGEGICLSTVEMLLAQATVRAAVLNTELEVGCVDEEGKSGSKKKRSAPPKERDDEKDKPAKKVLQTSIFHALGLGGPRFVSEEVSSSNGVCEGCGQDCTNSWGLKSHVKSCQKGLAAAEQHAEATRAWHEERKAARATTTTTTISTQSLVVNLIEESTVVYAHEAEADEDGELTDKETPPAAVDGRRGSDFRKSYSIWFKIRVLNLFEAVKKSLGRGAVTLVSSITNISKSNVTKWSKAKDIIRMQAAKSAGKRGRGFIGRILFSAPRGPKPMFPFAEEKVLLRFDNARAKRKSVAGRVLRLWMQQAVNEMYPNDQRAKEFKASQNWLSRFVNRNKLAIRRVTNKKEKSLSDRIPVIQAWHKTLHAFISKSNETTGIFGVLPPENAFNIDQSPVCLSESSNRTYARAGQQVIGISQKGSSDKRMATITICVRLAGDKDNRIPQPFISIIFKGTGKRITAREREAWCPGVHVQFSAKAWTTAETIKEWADAFIDWVKKDTHKKPGEPVLFMDNLGVQTDPAFRKHLMSGGVKPWYFPPNCTDMIQPVDRHLAVQVKKEMGRLLDDKLLEDEQFAEEYLGLADGTYPQWKCRVLLTHLLSKAWGNVCGKRDFGKLGLETGCVMPKAGVCRTEAGLANIVIDGWPNYTFDEAVPDVVEGNPQETLPSGGTSNAEATESTTEAEEQPPASDVEDQVDSSSDDSSDDGMNDASSGRDNEEKLGDDDSEPDGRMDDEIEDDDVIEYDEHVAEDIFADDTRDPELPAPISPDGYALAPPPATFPRMSALVKSRIMWAVDITKNGKKGWIVAEVIGGPPDPSSAARGITVQLKCSRRFDKNTPEFLLREKACAALSVENYGVSWYLLTQRK